MNLWRWAKIPKYCGRGLPFLPPVVVTCSMSLWSIMKALFFLADDRRRVLLITGTALLAPPMFVALLPAMLTARMRALATF